MDYVCAGDMAICWEKHIIVAYPPQFLHSLPESSIDTSECMPVFQIPHKHPKK